MSNSFSAAAAAPVEPQQQGGEAGEEAVRHMTQAEIDSVAFPQGFNERPLLPACRAEAPQDVELSDALAAGMFRRCVPTTDFDAQLRKIGL